MYDEPRLVAVVAPMVTTDQAGLSYFMHVYAAHSSFYYLPKFYNTLLDQAKCTTPGLDMDRAFSVPALVLLSQELREPDLLTIARARYTIVLAATQDALSDPQRATLDSTLAAILLLGLVEALEFRGRCDPRSVSPV